MGIPEFGTAYSTPYEYYASQSSLSPKTAFTKEQHEYRFFLNKSGLTGVESLGALQRAVWRAQSGLTPADSYTDTEHFNAYYANVPASIRTTLVDSAYRERDLVNLAQNPSYERVIPGPTVVRRNLVTRPAGNYVLASEGAGSGTRTLSSARSHSGTTSTRFQWNSGPAGVSIISAVSGATDFTPVPNKLYALSAWIYLESGNAPAFNVTNQSWGQPGVSVIKRSDTLVPGQWTRVYWVVRLDGVSATKLRVYSGVTAESVMYVDDVLFEAVPDVLPYFDGNTVDSSGIAYAWEGAVGASTSVAKSGVVEVRRNLALNPSGQTPLAANQYGLHNRWFGSGGAGTITWNNTGGGLPEGVTAFGRKTWTTLPTASQDVAFSASSSRMPVTAGEIFSVYGWLRTSATATSSYFMFRIYDTVSGGSILSTKTAPSANINSTWRRMGGTFTADVSGYVDLVFYVALDLSTVQIGTTIDATALTVEKAPTSAGYFDGDTTPDADLTPVWTGTAHNSQSVLYGTAVINAGTANTLTNSVALIRSTNAQGKARLRVMPQGTGMDTAAWAAGNTSGLGGQAVTFERGKTYTAMATLTLTAPQQGSTNTRARRITYNDSVTGWTTFPATTQSPNVAGTYFHRLTFTVDPAATWATVRLYNGATMGNDVYWDDFAIVEGEYTGDYFDGNMPNVLWRGTINGSTSHTFKV